MYQLQRPGFVLNIMAESPNFSFCILFLELVLTGGRGAPTLIICEKYANYLLCFMHWLEENGWPSIVKISTSGCKLKIIFEVLIVISSVVFAIL